MIPVDVGQPDYLFDLTLSELLSHAVKHCLELLSRNVATVVLVEEFEGCYQLALLLGVSESLRHHNEELVEGDHAVPVRVEKVDKLLEFLLGRIVAELPKQGLQLVRLYHTVAVLVESLEGLV